METGPLRLFVGLGLPGALREDLGAWQRAQTLRAAWSHPEGLHLTLAFLGSRPRSALPELEALASPVALRPSFELATTELGGFPRSEAA